MEYIKTAFVAYDSAQFHGLFPTFRRNLLPTVHHPEGHSFIFIAMKTSDPSMNHIPNLSLK
jgi:hypothetical protein